MALSINPASWFEIPAADIRRVKSFYESAFGIEMTDAEMGVGKMAWFPTKMGAAGATGSLVQGDGFTPSKEGSLVYLQVDSIDNTLGAIAEAGGKTLVPRTSIGEHGFIAHFEDCEGNRVALHEAPTA